MTPMLGIMASSRLSILNYSQTVLLDNPVSFWLMNETSGTSATDQGSANLALTYTNSPTLNQSTTLAGIPKAVSFDGTNDYAIRANNAAYNITSNGNWSVECWIKPNMTVLGSIFSIRSDANTSAEATLSNFGCDPSDGKITAYVAGASNTTISLASTSSLNDNAWHQLVLTATSGGSLIYYVDGVNTASTSTGRNSVAYDKCVVAAGNYVGSVIQPAKGLMAAFSIYSTTLSASRVTAHYNAGVS